MAETPMKFHWMGRDCDDLSRDELMDVIHYLSKQVESTREAMHSVIEINDLARRARERHY